MQLRPVDRSLLDDDGVARQPLGQRRQDVTRAELLAGRGRHGPTR